MHALVIMNVNFFSAWSVGTPVQEQRPVSPWWILSESPGLDKVQVSPLYLRAAAAGVTFLIFLYS